MPVTTSHSDSTVTTGHHLDDEHAGPKVLSHLHLARLPARRPCGPGRALPVRGKVDPDTYQQSAQESLGNMSEDQRGQYAQQQGAAADQQGVDHGWDGTSTDPQSLAQMTSNVHQQSPNLLSGLLGGGMGGAGGGGELGALGGLLGGGGAGGGPGGLLGGAGGPGGLLGGAGGGGGLGGLLGGSGGGAAAGGNPVMRAALAAWVVPAGGRGRLHRHRFALRPSAAQPTNLTVRLRDRNPAGQAASVPVTATARAAAPPWFR